jgi:O-antigen ligase
VVTIVLLARRRRLGIARIGAAVLGLGLVFLLLAPYLSGMFRLGRFRDPFEQPNWLSRIALFEHYWELFRTSPWVGNGLFNGRVSPLLAALGEVGQESWGANVGAHNWLLQSLADSGVLGGLGFVLLLAAAGRTFLAGARRAHPWFPHSAGWMAGFLAVVLHGLVEPNFHGKPFIYLFAVQLGLAEQVRRVTGAAGARQRPALIRAVAGTGAAGKRLLRPGAAPA